MNPLKPVVLHAGLLAAGAIAATAAWSKDRTPHTAQETNVIVWNARPSDVTRIVHETKGKKIELESREEKKGARWFLGKVDFPPVPGAAPILPPPKGSVFASVGPATKVAESFAPLKALRAVGKVPESREAEFGFDKKETSISITVGGKEHKLFVGGIAPGAGDMYVLDAASNEAYVLKSEPLRDLEAGEMRLIERDQHAFKELEIASAKVTAGGKVRQIVRGGPENKKFWADPADKEKADETVGNWMQKVDRLKVSEFAAKPDDARTVIVRIDYDGSSGNLGYFELSKTASTDATGKFDYWMMTEHTHLPGKLPPQTGDQVEQDLGSIVK